MIIKLFFALCLVSCVEDSQIPNPADCGPLPPAPYWEYTTHAGAPAEAHIPLHLWLQDLEWRKAVQEWAECVSPGSSNIPIKAAGNRM
jgi:hypothetical protein